MARYKPVCYEQDKFIPISFSKQILPGTFEFTLDYVVDNELDLSTFDERYNNDVTGCAAYDPAVLLKIVLYAYSRGVISSRKIAQACNENVIFMALSADTRPHFTTIASFIANMAEQIQPLFSDVLLYCDELGLIGKEMFAIDGCKLSSNASKEWSGTKAELEAKRKKLSRAVDRMLKSHQTADNNNQAEDEAEHQAKTIKTLRRQIAKLKGWLESTDEKLGKRGKPIKSNVTDNESAKMKTSHGVIQGYNGVAAVDSKHQIIVEAQAHGQGPEQDLLLPMVDGIEERFEVIGQSEVFGQTKVTADSGFHSQPGLKGLAERRIDGYIADAKMRQRDPRFADIDKYKARYRKERAAYEGRSGLFKPQDFDYDPEHRTCICPAGHALYRNGRHNNIAGRVAEKYTAPKSACTGCELRARCLRHPDRTAVRQVAFFKDKVPRPKSPTERMIEKIDSPRGKRVYHQRLGTVEPVFGNHRNHGLDRFTLRTRTKVNIQWLLYSVVHNLGKVYRYGDVFA